jgi:N-acetyl-anhydromuramyl-L-alanine amidase AmpD
VAPSGRLDEATRLVVVAFQRRFRPARVDGLPDRETLARLDGLLALS